MGIKAVYACLFYIYNFSIIMSCTQETNRIKVRHKLISKVLFIIKLKHTFNPLVNYMLLNIVIFYPLFIIYLHHHDLTFVCDIVYTLHKQKERKLSYMTVT